jgi:hypothetical protein
MASPVGIDYAALAKKHGGSNAPPPMQDDAAPTPPPTEPRSAFSLEPKTGAQVRDDLAASNQHTADVAQEWSADHPYAAGAAGAALALMTSGGLGAARAIAVAKSASARVSAMGAAAASASPVAKYAVANAVLQRMGLPADVASLAAVAISGYQRGAKPAAAPPATPTPPTAATPSMPPAAPPSPSTVPARVVGATPAPASGATAPPVALPRAASASPVPSEAPVSGPALNAGSTPSAPGPATPSPQMVRNELGIYARRAKLNLTPELEAEATALVRQGRTPAQAVAEIHLRQPAAPTPPQAAPDAAAPPTGVGPDEVAAYAQLLRSGKTPQEAAQAIEQLRTLAGRLGTPTPAAVRTRVAERNKTGRWQE